MVRGINEKNVTETFHRNKGEKSVSGNKCHFPSFKMWILSYGSWKIKEIGQNLFYFEIN